MSDIPLCKRLTLPPLKLANSLYPFRVPSPKTCVTLRKECTVVKYNSCQTVWVVQLMDKLPQRVSFPSTTASLVIVMYHMSTKVQPQKGIRNWVFTTWGTEGSWLHTRAVLKSPRVDQCSSTSYTAGCHWKEPLFSVIHESGNRTHLLLQLLASSEKAEHFFNEFFFFART